MSATGGFTPPGAIVPGHTQGLAHLGQADTETECVVFVGDRQIGELYEDGEVQTEEDRANAARVVKVWNAYPKLVEALRATAKQIERSTNPAANYSEFEEMRTARALLRELGEAP